MAPAAVQRHHQLPPTLFAEWLGGDCRFKVADERGVLPESQAGGDELLLRRLAQLHEPRRLRPAGGLV